MEDLLVEKDQWEVMDLGTKPTSMWMEYWEILDRKARSTIHLCLSNLVLLNVSGQDSANKLWEKLGNLYQSNSIINKLFL